MKAIKNKVTSIDWAEVKGEMDRKGYAVIPEFLSGQQCEALILNYDKAAYRKTVLMERYRFGCGEYKYFNYPLPHPVQDIRESVYSKLVPIANDWMEKLRMNHEFPEAFQQLQALCHENNQLQPTPLILKYGKGGFNTLHQDLYGNIFFPLQAVLFLNTPEKDYRGGEFVLTEQIPRAQSRAIVLKPGKGDMLIFTTNFRPVKGNRGYYRANMKHGVSEVKSGIRHTLGIIFHDAVS